MSHKTIVLTALVLATLCGSRALAHAVPQQDANRILDASLGSIDETYRGQHGYFNLHSAIRPMRFFSNYLDPSNILNFAIWSDAFSTRGRLLFECRASHGNRSAPPTVVRTFTLVHSLLTDKKSGPGWPRWPRSPAQIFYPHPGWPLSLYLLADAYLVVARLP